MVYLNVPAAGGATRFAHLDKTIQPEIGKLAAWCNQAGGRPNAFTLHAGLPVRAGAKYIITAWFRERPRRIAPVSGTQAGAAGLRT